jgi:TRAP transporter TAXI family solute receptor
MRGRYFLLHNWPAIMIAVTAAAILVTAVLMFRSMPPRLIVMATGAEGTRYYDVGERYRAALARANVEVRLVSTTGSVENLAMLLNPHAGASVALIEGGIIPSANSSQLASLGTVFYRPLWWFHRREIEEIGFDSLRGQKVSVGAEGSGTHRLSLDLIKRNGMEGKVGELLPLSTRAAAEKLLAGEIDVAFIVAGWESAVVQQLIQDDRIAVSGFPQADALVALYPFLNKVTLPRGVISLAKHQPPSDLALIATKASLVVRNDLHPAIQYLLLNAATEIHSGQNIFHRANQFPAPEAVDIPLSEEAVRFYKSGPPLLHEYFPFWIAVLIGKVIILLIPILGVLYPMTRFLPHLYDLAMRSKVLRMYGELRFLEDEMTNERCTGHDLSGMMTRLDRLEEQANRLKMPIAYASMLYVLRHHIDLVREGLRKHPGEARQ